MTGEVRVQMGGEPTILESVPVYGALRAIGLTVPADGGVGYAVGCLFQHLDGAAGSALYCNEGTSASCDFDLVTIA